MTVTLDTNVLIYAFDERDAVKQAIAKQVLRRIAELGAPLALQVVGEFQNAAVKRLKMPAPFAAASGHQFLATFRTFPYDHLAVERATSSFATGRLSYWDGLLIAAAEQVGITSLISEDMQDGMHFGRLEIVNPFEGSALSPRARTVLNLV